MKNPESKPVDWSRPIETVPCAKNPNPVACLYSSEEDGVALLGDWYDPQDGSMEGPHSDNDTPFFWKVNEYGRFVSLGGKVRNVVE